LPPGTHDNETAVGWWKDSATEEDREYLLKYMESDGSDIAWLFIRSSFSSVSRTAIVLMQVRWLIWGQHDLLSHKGEKNPSTHPPR
jgi:4-alpha-glucanotransferase